MDKTRVSSTMECLHVNQTEGNINSTYVDIIVKSETSNPLFFPLMPVIHWLAGTNADGLDPL